jgi:putative phosphoribosyl transferase
VFYDRLDAGKRLGEKLSRYTGDSNVVLAIPRGGVPVAIEVAQKIGADLDIVAPRKIAIPNNPEAGYGAVTEAGSIVLNRPLVKQLGLVESEIQDHVAQLQAEIVRRLSVYRRKLASTAIKGKTAIIVDDGLASGFTMLAAIESVRRRKVEKTVVAVPIASGSAYALVKPVADDLVCLVVSDVYPFAVANFYDHWHDLNDEEVLEYLKEWRRRKPFQ